MAQVPKSRAWLAAAAVGGGALLLWSKRYFNGTAASEEHLEDLTGKVVIVTGANTGIGLETASTLARQGATIVMACRSEERARDAMKEIEERAKAEKKALGSLEYMPLDLASQDSVRSFADSVSSRYAEVHVLVNNAGIMRCPHWKTKEGLEMQIGVNHVGHFLLTNLLMPSLLKAAEETGEARVVTVASRAHTRGHIDFDDLLWEKRTYHANEAYAQSKLANILFAKELEKRVGGQGVHSYSLHPGVIRTELARYMLEEMPNWQELLLYGVYPLFWLLTKSPVMGAQTSIYCAADKRLKGQGGGYYADCDLSQPIPEALDEEVASKLWAKTEDLVGQKFLVKE